MGKLIDKVLSSGKSTTSEKAEIIHISLKGKELGSNSFVGMLLKQVAENEHVSLAEASAILGCLTKKPAIIYFDDIMEASDRTLLSPGLLMEFGADIRAYCPEQWSVIITKSVESAKG